MKKIKRRLLSLLLGICMCASLFVYANAIELPDGPINADDNATLISPTLEVASTPSGAVAVGHNMSNNSTYYYRVNGNLLSLNPGVTTFTEQGWMPDIEYSINYKPDVKVTVLEGTANQNSIYQTASSAENKGNLVFVGDSFRINMLDYLVKDFAKCTIINRSLHMTNYTFRESLKDVDYLVIEAVERMDYDVYRKASEIYDILIKMPTE